MVLAGRIQNGVVVLTGGETLPEGQEVTVVVPAVAPTAPEISLKPGGGKHSVLDIPTFSVGEVLRPLSAGDDVLGEMLEGRV